VFGAAHGGLTFETREKSTEKYRNAIDDK